MAKAPAARTHTPAAEKKEPEQLPPSEAEIPAEQPAVPPCPYLISFEALAAIAQADAAKLRVELLARALHVVHYGPNARSSVWVDFLFGVLCFALEDARFSHEQSLVLLTLVNELFEFATRTRPHPTLEATYEQFRDRIRHVSTSVSTIAPMNSAAQPSVVGAFEGEAPLSPPSPMPLPVCFSADDVTHIVKFMTMTFFRHLRTYQRVFAVPRVSVTQCIPLAVDLPFPPPPLAAATLDPSSNGAIVT